MKKLILLILLGVSFLAKAQTPLNPVQLTTNSAYLEPSTGLHWYYNGATYHWFAALGVKDSSLYVTPHSLFYGTNTYYGLNTFSHLQVLSSPVSPNDVVRLNDLTNSNTFINNDAYTLQSASFKIQGSGTFTDLANSQTSHLSADGFEYNTLRYINGNLSPYAVTLNHNGLTIGPGDNTDFTLDFTDAGGGLANKLEVQYGLQSDATPVNPTDVVRLGDLSAYAPSIGSTGYIQNQTSATQTAGFNITGNGSLSSINVGQFVIPTSLGAGQLNNNITFDLGNGFSAINSSVINMSNEDNTSKHYFKEYGTNLFVINKDNSNSVHFTQDGNIVDAGGNYFLKGSASSANVVHTSGITNQTITGRLENVYAGYPPEAYLPGVPGNLAYNDGNFIATTSSTDYANGSYPGYSFNVPGIDAAKIYFKGVPLDAPNSFYAIDSQGRRGKFLVVDLATNNILYNGHTYTMPATDGTLALTSALAGLATSSSVAAKADSANIYNILPTYAKRTSGINLAGKIINFFGDSWVSGNGSSSPYYRFSTAFTRKVNGIENNLGVPGSTVEKRAPINYDGGTNLIDQISSIPVFDNTQGLIVTMSGINDVGQNGANYTTPNYQTDYGTFITACIAKGWPVNRIVIMAPGWVTAGALASYATASGNPAPTRQRLTSFVDATRQVSTSYGTIYVPTYYDMLADDTTQMASGTPSGLHPNNAEHGFIGNILSQTFGIGLQGNDISVLTATPIKLDFGGTVGNSSAGSSSNLKAIIYQNGIGAFAGLGYSSNTMEYQVPLGNTHSFYVNNAVAATIDPNTITSKTASTTLYSGFVATNDYTSINALNWSSAITGSTLGVRAGSFQLYGSPTNGMRFGTTNSSALGWYTNSVLRVNIDALGNLNVANLTPSLPVFTDASKNLTNIGVVPVANGGTGTTTSTGTGSNVLNTNPIFAGIITTPGETISSLTTAGYLTNTNTGLLGSVTGATNANVVNFSHSAWWGDSITWGTGSPDATLPNDYGVLSGFSVYNGGIPGQTSTQVLARFNANPSMWGYATFIEVGRNDISITGPSAVTTIEANIASMVAALGHTRYIVFGVLKTSSETTGTANANAINTLNSYLSTTYGNNYKDMEAILQAHGNGSTADNAAIAAGTTPPSLLSDGLLHPNALGNSYIASDTYTSKNSVVTSTSTRVINEANSTALNQYGNLQSSLLTGGRYQIGGGQVLWEPNQSTTAGSLYAGNGGQLTTTAAVNNLSSGINALLNLADGTQNAAGGTNAGYNLVHGSQNALWGFNAGSQGDFNWSTFLGNGAGGNASSTYGSVGIGYFSNLPTNGSDNWQLSIMNAIYGTSLDGFNSTISTGNIGLFVKAPTARLHLPAGTAVAGKSPEKFSTGVVSQTTLEQGALNWDGANLYIGSGSTPVNQQLAYIASPIFSGNPQVPTQSPGNQSSSIASTLFVQQAVYPAGVLTGASTLTLLLGTDYFFNGTTATVTLPTPTGSTTGRGYQVTIKNAGSGNLTVNASLIYSTSGGSASTYTMAPGMAATFMPFTGLWAVE